MKISQALKDRMISLLTNQKQEIQSQSENLLTETETFSKRFEIIEEIESYNKCLSLVTWNSIFNLLNVNQGSTRFNVVNFSSYGSGKSRSTLSLFKELDLPKTRVYSGHLTEKGFFLFLCQHIDYNIIIDETEIIDRKVKGILKSALYDGNVSWINNKENIDIDFKGSIIFNCNEIDKGITGILDRTFFNKIFLRKEDIIKKSDSRLNYTRDEAVWKVIRDRILYIRNLKEKIELTDEEIQGINNFIGEILSGISSDAPLSMRLNSRVELVFKCVKNFFGKLTVDLWKFAEDMSINYIKYSPQNDKDIFTDIVNSRRRREEDKIDEFIKRTGKSRKTYYNWKKERELIG